MTAGVARSAGALALCALGCGARPYPAARQATLDEILLGKDRALVIQRVEIVAVRAGPATRAIELPAGVVASDVEILDRGELAAARLQIAGAGADLPPVRGPAPA